MLTTLKLLTYMELLIAFAIFVFARSLQRDKRGILLWRFWAIMMLMPVVGIFGRSVYVFYAFTFLVPLLSIGSRQSLVCTYLLMLPLYPDLGGNTVVGGIYLGDFSSWKIFNLGALIALMIVPDRARQRISALDVSVWTMFVVAVLLYGRGVPFSGVLRVVVTTFLSMIPPYYVVARCIQTQREAENASLFFILGGFVNAVVAVFEAKRHWPMFESIYRTLNFPLGLSASIGVRGGFMRAQGVLNNSTVVAVLLALTLIACIAMRRHFGRLGFVVVTTIMALGLLAAQSRGSWLAAGAGLTLLWLYERKLGRVMALLSFGVAGWLLILSLPKEGAVGQLIGRSGHGEETADYRSQLLVRGLQEVRQHPLIGQTRAQLELSMSDLRQGQHIIDFVNAHLNVALVAGLSGFCLWMLAWAVALQQLWRARPRLGLTLSPNPGLAFSFIGVCFVALIFTSTVDRMLPFTTVSFGFAAALILVARNLHRERLNARKAFGHTFPTNEPATNSHR